MTDHESSEQAAPIAYDPNAVLEIEHVARWLRVSVRTVERLDVPCIYLGDRTKRYLARHVIEYLDRKRVA